MRFLPIVIVLGSVQLAHADNGYFFEESFGGGGYKGGLSAYGDGGFRLQMGMGHRRGEWSYEALGGAIVPDFLYVDCYGEECNVDDRVGWPGPR